MKQAERGLTELAASCDTVITIPNEKLLTLAPKGTGFFEAFRMADDVLRQAVQGIADIILTPGLINRDFSDIRTIMLGMGYAMMGTASATGESASIEAARKAINSPLMEEGGIFGARGVLINITASSKLGIHDVNEACNLIRTATQNDDVQINFGVVMDESMDDEVKITVIATGFQRDTLPNGTRVSSSVPSSIFEQQASSDSAQQAEQNGSDGEGEQQPEYGAEEAPNDFDTPAFLRKKRQLVQ